MKKEPDNRIESDGLALVEMRSTHAWACALQRTLGLRQGSLNDVSNNHHGLSLIREMLG